MTKLNVVFSLIYFVTGLLFVTDIRYGGTKN